MALENTNKKTVVISSGSELDLPYNFYCRATSDIKLRVVDTVGVVSDVVSGFTVTLNGDYDGGKVTLSTAYPSGYTITIYRDTERTQNSEYGQGQRFDSSKTEGTFDKVVSMIQEQDERLDRSLKVDIEDTGSNQGTTLKKEDRKDKVLGFDGDGKVRIDLSYTDIVNAVARINEEIQASVAVFKLDAIEPHPDHGGIQSGYIYARANSYYSEASINQAGAYVTQFTVSPVGSVFIISGKYLKDDGLGNVFSLRSGSYSDDNINIFNAIDSLYLVSLFYSKEYFDDNFITEAQANSNYYASTSGAALEIRATDIESDISSLDGRVTQNEADIANRYTKAQSDQRYIRFADTSFIGTDNYLFYYLYKENIVGDAYFNLRYQPSQEGIYLEQSTRNQFEANVIIYNATTTLGQFKLTFTAGRYNTSTILSDVFYEVVYKTVDIDTSDVEVFIEDYQVKIKVRGKTGVTVNCACLVSAVSITEKTIQTSDDFGTGVFRESITSDFRLAIDEETSGVYEGNVNTEEIETDFTLSTTEETTGIHEGNYNTEEITTDFNITVTEETP